MRSQSGDERPSGRCAEPRIRESLAGTDSAQPESQRGEWTARNAKRSKEVGEQPLRAGDEWTHQAPVRVRIKAKGFCSDIDGAIEHGGGAIIQRMRER